MIIILSSILLVAVVIAIVILVNNAKDEENLPDGPSNRETFEGEIIEINTDGTIVVKCTKERTQLIKKMKILN